MLTKIALSMGVALAVLASPVQAVEHRIEVHYGEFFPYVTYLQAGDTVRFVNLMDRNVQIKATRYYNRWYTGWMAPGGESVVTINSNTQLKFQNDHYSWGFQGELSFSPAPNS